MTITSDAAYAREVWLQVSQLQFEPLEPPRIAEQAPDTPPPLLMREVSKLRTERHQRQIISAILAGSSCAGLVVGAGIVTYLAGFEPWGSGAIALSACMGVILHWSLLSSYYSVT